MSTHTEYAIHWEHVDGMPDIAFVSTDIEVPKQELAGSVFNGLLVTRQITETPWKPIAPVSEPIRNSNTGSES